MYGYGSWLLILHYVYQDFPLALKSQHILQWRANLSSQLPLRNAYTYGVIIVVGTIPLFQEVSLSVLLLFKSHYPNQTTLIFDFSSYLYYLFRST